MKKYVYNLFFRIFIAFSLFIIICFLYNNDKTYKYIDNIIFDSSIDFAYIRSKTKLLLGKFTGKSTYVLSEKLEYKKVEKYNNSFKFITDPNYVIKNTKAGTVIYIGEVESLGNSISIEIDSGEILTFSNLDNINVNIYDYINEGTILGSVKEDYFYLTIEKDNQYLEYEDYI